MIDDLGGGGPAEEQWPGQGQGRGLLDLNAWGRLGEKQPEIDVGSLGLKSTLINR